MSLEDYVAKDATNFDLFSNPLNKKQSFIILGMLIVALSFSMLVPKSIHTSIDNQPTYTADDFFASNRSVDESLSLLDALNNQANSEVIISVDDKPMDNFDDTIDEKILADSDDDMDEKLLELAANSEPNKLPIVTSKWFVEEVQKGDTISSMFTDLNIPVAVAMSILENKEVAREINNLRLGSQLSFLIDDKNTLQSFVKPINNKEQLRFYRSEDGKSYAYVKEPLGTHLGIVEDPAQSQSAQQIATNQTQEKKDNPNKDDNVQLAQNNQPVQAQEPKKSAIESRGRLVHIVIAKGDSFSGAANRAGVSYAEINQILRMFKGRIQFSKSIHVGDEMRVLYSDANGKGKINAVEIKLGKKTYASYLNASDGKYYDENGLNSTTSAFRRFPLDGKIKVSSPFNPNRMHPKLGIVRPHNGTDFSVPIGTKVIAPADGVVDKATYSRGAGYYVVVRHRGGYSTVYMHLSKILVKPGQQVKLGQVIARSGNTGLSTGPHLHYELRINGRPVNAMKVNLGKASDVQVDNKQRQRFIANVKQYKQDLYNKKFLANNN